MRCTYARGRRDSASPQQSATNAMIVVSSFIVSDSSLHDCKHGLRGAYQYIAQPKTVSDAISL